MNSSVHSALKNINTAIRYQPEGHTIIPRKGIFPFSPNIPRNWQGEMATTRFFDLIQLGFPDGERMFINSIRNYKNVVEALGDPDLSQRVKDFNYQEGQHGLAHTEYTELLSLQGIRIDRIMAVVKPIIEEFQKVAPHKFQLAATVAAEHVTATLAEGLIENDFGIFDDDCDPVMGAFYAWHAIEEIEHKSVAWEVYDRAAEGDYLTRCAALLLLLSFLVVILGAAVPALLVYDGKFNRKEIPKGYKRFLGKKGFVRKRFSDIIRFISPDFFPWDNGVPKYFQEWKEAYDETSDPIHAYQTIKERMDATKQTV